MSRASTSPSGPAAPAGLGPGPVLLGDGLLLRAAEPSDVDAILELETAAFGASDGPGVRANLIAPGALGDWTVVVAADGRLVSASGLLSHRMTLDGRSFPAGQPEYVATDPAYQRRGLVRAQFAWHHRRAAERGDLALFITGIPYLYRRFGYGYGLDYPPLRAPGPLAAPAGDVRLRPATAGDLDAVAAIDARRPDTGLRVERDHAAWAIRAAICHDNDWEQLWVAERPGAATPAVVGWIHTQRKPEHQRAYVVAAGVHDDEPPTSTLAMIAHARAVADPDVLVVWDAPGTAFSAHLGELPELGGVLRHDHGIYVRVPDPVALLDRLRPVLSARLGASRYADRTQELIVSLYDAGVALRLADGTVRDVRWVDGIEDPHAARAVGVAPDWFGALVFGRYGAIGLEQRVDDVTLGKHRGVMDVLFPELTADVAGDL